MNDDLDPRLKELYAQMPKDEPAVTVDEAILRAAALPVSSPRRRDWLLGFGAVASVVLVSSMVVYLQTREPEQWRSAISVRPEPASTPLPESKAVMAKGASAAEPVTEQEMAARRSAELARLRAEFAAKRNGDEKQVTPSAAPADLPTVKLRPTAPADEMSHLAEKPAVEAADALHDAPSPPLRQLASAPPAARADMALGKMKAQEAVSAPAGIASVLIEGVSLGMKRGDLIELGWGCAQAVCSRQIIDPRQPDYWGLPVAGATQRVLFVRETITAMTLSQVNVPINNLKIALERIGRVSERTCPMGVGEQLLSRQAGGMILNLWLQGEVTVLGVCQER